jgi:outer membrane protein OmpA-like peptidoglycan-associated protein
MYLARATHKMIAVRLLLLCVAGLPMAGCKRSAPASPSDASSSDTPSTTPPSTPGSSSPSPAPSGTPGGSAAATTGDQPGSLADRLKAVQTAAAQSSDKPAPKGPPPLPDWKAAQANGSAMVIPLIPGLTVDSTIESPIGDLDELLVVSGVDANTITDVWDVEVPPKTPGGRPKDLNGPPLVTGKGTVVLDVADLASSNYLVPFYGINKTVHRPGTLTHGVSKENLNQLRSGKPVELQIVTTLDEMMTASLKMRPIPTVTQWRGVSIYPCKLQRVEAVDIAVPVLVNNEQIELPSIHVKCVLDTGKENHYYILDQLSNPVFLYSRTGTLDNIKQTITISFDTKSTLPADSGPGGGAAARRGAKNMEQKLADKEPVEIYGIYFDFNSAYIKPESEVVLKQISDILHKNPSWKLSVSGHTDNIGANDFNLQLSQARAAAVKAALVKEYKIDPNRLTTSGYGASQPIADNTKVEGRARNRRVVLQRQ